ncbi:F0F1 ATP synthase subunit delta [Mangrovibacillus cuniculi]|uniref:ATP synthase subunit delta n=1 Tax=Mangrovibacillus cuniculi TaxID=2593652 RepID=A0A7S8HGR6_9BACI|nr:F0F1 ATP synthase subunit delta [Mangrovibacillus cuniculi]QPC47705.1 F0F1 ATP synthase subunit delta [Mangrovibacillus cuniculi]
MKQSTVAKRYAQALYEVAVKNQQVDLIESELSVVKQVVVNNPEILTVLGAPKLSLAKKKEMVGQAFASASDFVRNTLFLLVDRHRMSEVTSVIDAYSNLVNEAKGRANATVYSVRALTQEEQVQISAAYAPKVGKSSLHITNIVDPSILGGLKVRIGNRIFDATLQGKMDRLTKKLVIN